MAQLTISQDIHPISDLKSRAGEIVHQVTETRRPVVLTRHGRGVAVVLSVEEYERLQHAAEQGALLAALGEGQRDFEEGRVLSQLEMRTKWLEGGNEEP
ncbi:MAG: type II toxin-antitoxin system Phd/YefM family antitoxin [Acidobacteriota bacterium]